MERKGATARTARIVVIALLPLSIAFGLYSTSPLRGNRNTFPRETCEI